MSDLDPEVMSIFMREESSSAAEATQVCASTMLPHTQEHNYNRVSTSGETLSKGGCIKVTCALCIYLLAVSCDNTIPGLLSNLI